MADFIDKNWAEYQKAQEKPDADDMLPDCGGIKQLEIKPMLEEDKDPPKTLKQQRAEAKKEILKKLQDPNLSKEEEDALMDELYEGIEIRKEQQKTVHEKWEDGGVTILLPKTDT